jgi:hypothetical protein
MMKQILDRKITNKLSLAVSLKDDFTDREEVIGEVKVSIPSLRLEGVKNPSGYYNFFDLAPDTTYKVRIKSGYYIDKDKDIFIPIPPPGYVLESVILQPGPLYPFPLWATLIRGTVKDSSGNSIAGAAVQVAMPGSPPHLPYTVSTKTTSRGQFVLYFPIWQESVSSQTVAVASTTATGVIEKCKTTSMTVTL